jgi:acyl carrier protein
MNSLESINQKSHDIVLDLLPNLSSEKLLDDQDLFSLGLDSVNAMMLVLNLQEAFEVTFETCEISFENFQTISNIVELIKKKARNSYTSLI